MALRRPPAVARVLERVTATARAHEMFEPGDVVLASVSGGPDSLCLLEALIRLRRLFRIRIEVFHLDHRLREASSADAAYVRSVAARLGLPVHVRVAEDEPAAGRSVEAWATAARLRASHQVAHEVGANVIVEGHTLDDQAETVLVNIIRGTGLEGVAGILPSAGEHPRVVQPLLEVARDEVEACCRSLGLRPRRDPMNEDRRLLRTAIRLDVLPAIEAATGRNARSPLARTAENLRADRAELDAATVGASAAVVTGARGGDVSFDAAGLRALSPVIAARVVRLAVYDALSSDWAAPWSKAAIDAVLDLASGRPGRSRALPEGRVARRTRTHVVVARR